MSWRDRLLAGSFRGAGFSIESHDSKAGGRRLHVHEYPGRDDPYAEDLGAVTGDFEVNAFVLGDDYDRQRDALIRACNAPGSGVLVHPYLGLRRVACSEIRVSERASEGRMARITMQFIAAGANKEPASLVDTAALLVDRAASAAEAAAREFISGFQA